MYLAEDMSTRALQGIVQHTLADTTDQVLIGRCLKAINVVLGHLTGLMVLNGSASSSLGHQDLCTVAPEFQSTAEGAKKKKKR